jgi:hypothetical protein
MTLKPKDGIKSTPVRYTKAQEEKLKEAIDKASEEVFKGWVDEPGYFACVDPIDGNYNVLIFSPKMGTIEEFHEKMVQMTGIPKTYLGKK